MGKKYRTLLVGSQRSIIDEFFFSMQNHFDCITTSSRRTDIMRHLDVFNPELFILCVKSDMELARTVAIIKNELKKRGVICIVAGEPEDVTNFVNEIPEAIDIVLKRPLTNKIILEKIEDYIDEREKFRLEQEKKEREEREREEEKNGKKEDNRKHILIVDDDPNILKLLKAQLEDKFNVATAVNGSLALRFLTKKTTDLILLDYEMPGQGGDTVLSILRRGENTQDIPVIFLTGVTDTAKIAKVLALKPQGYLLKPVDNQKLMTEIGKVLGD